jgi:hypothetical protein
MKKIILLLLLLLLTYLFAPANSAGTLTDILKPETIRVSGNQLYVVEGAVVFVYKTLGVVLRFYDFHKDRFIYIQENQDTEEWHVHVLPL